MELPSHKINLLPKTLHLLIFIITLFLSLHLTPIPAHAQFWVKNCQENQVFVVNGSIVVNQTITDIPKDWLELYQQGKESLSFDIIYTNNGLNPWDNEVIATTKQFEVINHDTVKITYTIDPFRSQELAKIAQQNNNSLEGLIDIRINAYGEKTDTKTIRDYCEFDLTAAQIKQIEDPSSGSSSPTGACPNGCQPGEACKYSGNGDITDPANWSCQPDSLARVNVHGSCDSQSIDTAIGCLPLQTKDFTFTFVRYAIGLAGLVALIVMLVATTLIMTGGSNPEQVKKGKEIFTSAIMGLLFIIFSAVILKIINQDILGGIF